METLRGNILDPPPEALLSSAPPPCGPHPTKEHQCKRCPKGALVSKDAVPDRLGFRHRPQSLASFYSREFRFLHAMNRTHPLLRQDPPFPAHFLKHFFQEWKDSKQGANRYPKQRLSRQTAGPDQE